jgi:hypothetical protein
MRDMSVMRYRHRISMRGYNRHNRHHRLSLRWRGTEARMIISSFSYCDNFTITFFIYRALYRSGFTRWRSGGRSFPQSPTLSLSSFRALHLGYSANLTSYRYACNGEGAKGRKPVLGGSPSFCRATAIGMVPASWGSQSPSQNAPTVSAAHAQRNTSYSIRGSILTSAR